MIKGIHGLFYTSEPESLRAFLRDKLGLPCCDVGDGWLIFDFEEGDLGCHPTGGHPGDGGPPPGAHDISFFCDDIHATVAELKSRGVEFTQDIVDRGYGLVTYIRMPGDVTVQLYEPKYEKGQ